MIYSPIDIHNINELISILVKEDFVFYLPDDNVFAPTYIETQLKSVQ
ncbi:hypothetical protein X808_150 [Mannheimia varigena USDA-ARS-USMARC-1296]|uniref:Uncharacterized protein n=1 Tax=Mannheimia varigena USDA-ARS-USMARC-1296 TaxID=1433287 RepID=W0Q7N4_9PAST|nr:hypothetical protein X808_150 [Mannheimia varigena USDA-ARS-USMARC-1296]